MSVDNLATVIGVNLIRSKVEDPAVIMRGTAGPMVMAGQSGLMGMWQKTGNGKKGREKKKQNRYWAQELSNRGEIKQSFLEIVNEWTPVV